MASDFRSKVEMQRILESHSLFWYQNCRICAAMAKISLLFGPVPIVPT